MAHQKLYSSKVGQGHCHQQQAKSKPLYPCDGTLEKQSVCQGSEHQAKLTQDIPDWRRGVIKSIEAYVVVYGVADWRNGVPERDMHIVEPTETTGVCN